MDKPCRKNHKTMTDQSNLIENCAVTLAPRRKKNRIWEIDFLRGFCIILMVFDHLALLLGGIFGPSWFGKDMLGTGFGPTLCRLCEYYYYDSTLRQVGHQAVLFIFFSVSGISCYFSRSNVKRGLQLAVIAVLYSVISYFVDEYFISDTLVTFGVLHFYAACILIYALIGIMCAGRKIPKMVCSAAIILAVVLTYHLYVPPADTELFLFPLFPYRDAHGVASLFYSQNAVSPGDLFTLIPYASFFFFGTFIGPVLYGRKKSLLPALDGKWNKAATFVGRHALPVYILHVVVLTALLAIISYLFITPGSFGF